MVSVTEPTEPAEPTQRTQPKNGKPIDIPVLKRDDIERLLMKAAKGAGK